MTKTIVAAVWFSLAIGVVPALAQQDQQPPLQPRPRPLRPNPTKSTMTPEQKAISKPAAIKPMPKTCTATSGKSSERNASAKAARWNNGPV